MPPATDGTAAVAKRSLSVAGHRTSVSLEDAFWTALRDIAEARGLPLAGLVAEIDRGRGAANLSSAIRVHVLAFYRQAAGASPAT
jgi:predicted DNA-binding ribbon-helix-helix protein